MLDGRFARGSQLEPCPTGLVPGLVLAIAAAAQLKSLAMLELGDELSAGLGIDVQRSRWSIAAIGVLLVAAGVAVAGPIPFVALMAGPFGSRLTEARSLKGKLTSAAAAGALHRPCRPFCKSGTAGNTAARRRDDRPDRGTLSALASIS